MEGGKNPEIFKDITVWQPEVKVFNRYVKRMMNKPGCNDQKPEGKAIWEFLEYDGSHRKVGANAATWAAHRKKLVEDFKAKYPKRYEELEGRERSLAKVYLAFARARVSTTQEALARPPRLLLVYGYEPSGHAAAAFALEEAGRRARPSSFPGSRSRRDHHPASGLRRRARLSRPPARRPAVWGSALPLDGRAGAPCAACAVPTSASGGARRLLAGVRRRGADVMVCPQASVPRCSRRGPPARRARRARRVRDDRFGAHPFWCDPPADLLSASAARRPRIARLRRAAGPGPRRRPADPSGFRRRPSRADAPRALALPAAAPAVLVSGGSQGTGELDRAAAALLRESRVRDALALCGPQRPPAPSAVAPPLSGARLRVFGPQPPRSSRRCWRPSTFISASRRTERRGEPGPRRAALSHASSAGPGGSQRPLAVGVRSRATSRPRRRPRAGAPSFSRTRRAGRA